jgi:hypothetical protein
VLLTVTQPCEAENNGCQSGVRSARAKQLLRAAGAMEVHDLGGMSRWGGLT